MQRCRVRLVVVVCFLFGALARHQDDHEECQLDTALSRVEAETPVVQVETPEDLVGPLDVCETKAGKGRCSNGPCGVPAPGGPGYQLHGRINRANKNVVPMISGDSKGLYCAVSHVHRFIFLHVPKVGGSATKGWLCRALCGEACPSTCNKRLFARVSCSSVLRSNPEYFRWTFSRPVSDRAVSVYGMARQKGLDKSISLEEFWLMGSKRWGKTALNSIHAQPQMNFIASRTGCLAVDFLGSLATADDDMKRLLAIINSAAMNAYYAKHGFEKPEHGNIFGTGVEQRAHETAHELVSESPRLAKYLKTMFARDLTLCDPRDYQ